MRDIESRNQAFQMKTDGGRERLQDCSEVVSDGGNQEGDMGDGLVL